MIVCVYRMRALRELAARASRPREQYGGGGIIEQESIGEGGAEEASIDGRGYFEETIAIVGTKDRPDCACSSVRQGGEVVRGIGWLC